MTDQHRPGWYAPDPDDPDTLRWWNGKKYDGDPRSREVMQTQAATHQEQPAEERAVDVQVEKISIFAGEPSQPYKIIGRLRARVTAATIFSKTPTVEDANLKLRERAAPLGANAVINVTYERGPSATSWKALTAEGTAVVLDASAGDEQTPTDALVQLAKLGELRDAGVLTEAEFEAKKTGLLRRIQIGSTRARRTRGDITLAAVKMYARCREHRTSQLNRQSGS